ncbi:MAG: hypothetical protein AB3N64_03600 [Puniceicoccaceae bacterium]
MPPITTDNGVEPGRPRGLSGAACFNAGLIMVSMALATFISGCGKAEPEYVEVQEVAESPQAELPEGHSEHDGHDHSAHAAPAAGFGFSLPQGWVEKAPSSMVLKAFQTGTPPENMADVSVSAFAGDVGGQAANINRWRRQVGLPPLDPDSALALVKQVEISGMDGWQVSLTGPAGVTAGGEAIQMVVSAVSHNGKTWFFKMAGPASAVEGELDSYGAFIDSIKF